MDYAPSEEPPNIWLIAVLTGFFLLVGVFFQKGIEMDERGHYGSVVMIQGNTLAPISSTYWREPIIYRTLGEKIIWCESNGDNSKVGKAGEIGIAQFMPETFKLFSKMAGKEWLDIYSEEDQRYLLEWAIKNGYIHHWTCAKKI